MKVWIPDVSEHQGKIDWGKLKGKIPGVVIRIGYGDDLERQDDKYAEYNMTECERLGIPYAVYIYSYADSQPHIQSEIAHTKRMCKGHSPRGYVLDIEEWDLRGFALKAAEAWLEEFKERGLIYAGQAYWKGPLKGLDTKRWIPAYGTNDGTKQDKYKPPYDMTAWQFTSRYAIAGIKGNVDMSEWYGFPFAGSAPVEIAPEHRAVKKKEVAALIMRHLATHIGHGYTQDMEGRQGTGCEEIDIYGHTYKIAGGDRDCSSAVISAYEAAGISCGGATYTGNMRTRMVGTGNFKWRPMSFTAQMGDSYLNERSHTAMCMSAEPDILAEFSINEKGGTLGGKAGDQKQVGEYDETLGRGESHLKEYYDYPWDGILECVNDEVAFWIGEDGGNSTEIPVDSNGNSSHEDDRLRSCRLAAKTILGDFGNDKARMKALGEDYGTVQPMVTEIVTQHREELIDAMTDFIGKTLGMGS